MVFSCFVYNCLYADIYIDRVKGDGFFSFRFSNFQLYDVYACVCIPACTGRSAYVYYNVHLH